MSCKFCDSPKCPPKEKVCYSCRYKMSKDKNPMKLAYRSLRGHAKERGKEFSITFEEFKQFCVKSDYITKRGIGKHSYHIDRIEETKGYVAGNLQLLTNSENIKKYIRFIGISEDCSKVFKVEVQTTEITISNETPF